MIVHNREAGRTPTEVGFRKGCVGEAHSHGGRGQVSYVVCGSFEVRLGDRQLVLGPGDSFHAGRDVLHGVKALEDGVLLDVFTPIREELLE